MKEELEYRIEELKVEIEEMRNDTDKVDYKRELDGALERLEQLHFDLYGV